MGRILLIIILFAFSGGAQAQKWKTVSEELVDTFDSGKTHAITTTTKKTRLNPPLHEFYERTRVNRLEYFESGQKKSILKHIEKKATWGRPCEQVIYIHLTYYADGTRKSYEKRKCDKHRSVIKTYNKKGKLLKKTIEVHTYNKADK